jgi:transposase
MKLLISGGGIFVSNIFYSESDQHILLRNPNVEKVTDRYISYHPDFKIKAVKEYLSGKKPRQIFMENGFNLELIGDNKPFVCIRRWRIIFKQRGEQGLREEGRNRKGTRLTGREPSIEDKLKKAEAKIKFLEAENELLKKIREKERRR